MLSGNPTSPVLKGDSRLVPDLSFGISNQDDVFTAIGKSKTAKKKFQKTSLALGGDVEKRAAKIKRNPVQGRVINFTGNRARGFIKPDRMPEGYPSDRDVMFYCDQVRSGYLNLIEGDTLGFTLGTKDKEKPMAFSVQLLRCAPRGADVLIDWIEQSLQKLQSGDEEHNRQRTKYAIEILSCDTIWETIGHCRNPPDMFISSLLNLLLYINSEFQSIKKYFVDMLHIWVYSPFFDSRKGAMKIYIDTHLAESCLAGGDTQLCQMMILLVQLMPHKARLFVSFLHKSFECKSPFENFLYIIVREITKQCCGEIEDMEWDEVPLVPNNLELCSESYNVMEKLRPVLERGPYSSAADYMDIYFRLLRADCFCPLKKGITDFLKGKLDHRDMNVYYNVSIVGVHFTTSIMSIGLKFTTQQQVRDWKTTSKLMFGNLLCLSTTGTFSDPIWATVSNRNVLPKHNVVLVELLTECNTMTDYDAIIQLHSKAGNVVMAESPTYYRAHQPVLKTLQQVKPDDLPFSDELVSAQAYGPPEYLETNSTASVDTGIIYKRGKRMDIISLAYEESEIGETTFDPSQEAALKQALINRVAIIQGPPGTGKTFIGTKLVQLLLSCKERPYGPILVLTYKNHALDEFLCGLLKEGITNIIRVGGGSRQGPLEKYNMNEVKRERGNRMQDTIFTQWLEAKNTLEESKYKLENTFKKMDLSRSLSETQFLHRLTVGQLCNLVRGQPNMNRHMASTTVDSELMLLDDDFTDMAVKALKQWLPGKAVVTAVENELKSYLTNQHAFTLSVNEKPNATDDDILDETDVKRQLEERMSAMGFNKIQDGKDIMKEIHMMKTHQKNGLTLLDGVLQAAKKEPIHILQNVEDMWTLEDKQRVKFIQAIIVESFEENATLFQEELANFEQLAEEKNILECQHRGQVAAQADIIGMTITGASINRAMVEISKPPIVIVEEAAEVLEPQLVSVLGKWVQQLIMIGDHKQLRPGVETFELEKNFHFDISLMERLINNKFPYAQLLMQNRMRPEFAELLLDIYPLLQSNLARVGNNPPPQCCNKAMFFWDHNNEETYARSYTNDEEAERAVKLALFMLRQGYEPKSISILGAYQGQVALIRRKLLAAKQKFPECFVSPTKEDETEDVENRVQVMTVDMFQGDENDIVIVSLVRCNDRKQAGFLKLLNRRCVAQSRARCGMYIIGSVSTLQSTHWKTLINKMDAVQSVGKYLPLCCPKHKEITQISVPNGDSIPLGNFCKISCDFPMPCSIHTCKESCQPPHQHHRCQQKVDFTFPSCGHAGKKMCFQSIESRSCIYKFNNVELPCGHRGDRICCQRLENVICNAICAKPLPCKHLCQNKCCQPCNAVPCEECEKIRKIQAELERKKQEELLKVMRESTSLLIEKLIKDKENLVAEDASNATLEVLKPTGDTASEYYSVEDKVNRYIQPDHKWFPHITKIEKVTNLSLEIKFQKRKLILNGIQTESKFHGTAAADMIVEKGFRLPKPNKQMYGPGIYFASDSSKSAQEMYTKGSNTLLLCDVLLGRSLTVTSAQPDITLQKLKAKNYDSVYAKRDTRQTGGVLYDEYIVYHVDQALPRFIIHYNKTLDFITKPVPTGHLAKFTIKPVREYDETDEMQMHFRIAESQVLRMLQRNTGSSLTLKSVDYYQNPTLISHFKKKQDEFKKKYRGQMEEKPVLAFHGTDEKNIDSIVKDNLSMTKKHRGVYGSGIYFSEFPDVSLGYGKGLLLCRVLPGKPYDCPGAMNGQPLQIGYDSHRVQKDKDGMGQMLVIFNEDQILPCYVIHLE